MRKLISLISLFFSISFLLIFFSTCTDNIQSVTDINQTPDVPLIFENEELLYLSKDLEKVLRSEFGHVEIKEVYENRLILTLQESDLKKTLFEFIWNDDFTFFSTKISRDAIFKIEFGEKNDIPALSIFKDENLLISYKFNKENKKWVYSTGDYKDKNIFRENYPLLINKYSPLSTKLIDYVQNPSRFVNKSQNPQSFDNSDIKNMKGLKTTNCNVQNKISASSISTCSGTMHYENAYGSNEVTCCWSAETKVDGSCTNGYCLGCCQIGCFPNACGPFGYHCICEGIGRACSFCDAFYDAPGC